MRTRLHILRKATLFFEYRQFIQPFLIPQTTIIGYTFGDYLRQKNAKTIKKTEMEEGVWTYITSTSI